MNIFLQSVPIGWKLDYNFTLITPILGDASQEIVQLIMATPTLAIRLLERMATRLHDAEIHKEIAILDSEALLNNPDL